MASSGTAPCSYQSLLQSTHSLPHSPAYTNININTHSLTPSLTHPHTQTSTSTSTSTPTPSLPYSPAYTNINTAMYGFLRYRALLLSLTPPINTLTPSLTHPYIHKHQHQHPLSLPHSLTHLLTRIHKHQHCNVWLPPVPRLAPITHASNQQTRKDGSNAYYEVHDCQVASGHAQFVSVIKDQRTFNDSSGASDTIGSDAVDYTLE
jgi:hypothetical protein